MIIIRMLSSLLDCTVPRVDFHRYPRTIIYLRTMPPVFEARFYKAISRVAGGALIKTISRKIQRAPSNGRTNVRANEYISKIRYVFR